MVRSKVRLRAVVLASAVACMVAGVVGGLGRMGLLDLPLADRWSDAHGPLMICGLFGTLISLERAAAYDRAWAYLAPCSFAAGGLCLVAAAPSQMTATLFVLGAAAFVLVTLRIFLLQRAAFTAILVVGAVALLVGNVLLVTGWDVPTLVGEWLVFLVATIVAERLELSRVLAPPRTANVVLVALVATFVLGAALGILERPGRTMAGMALIGVVLWLARYDLATRTVRMTGQPRFMALAMLLGYAWLAITAALLLLQISSAFEYDMILHAVFIGFVLSMVMGHALIIFPGLTGVALRYSPWLLAPLLVLHLGLAARILGDLLEIGSLRSASGPMVLAALVSFALVLVLARRRTSKTSI